LQKAALDRTVQLILQVCGGTAGPVTMVSGARPRPVTVRLRKSRLDQLLGHAIAESEIERLLKRLGIGLKRSARGIWQARIPGHRYDLRIEADLIEEVARLYGYDRIPARPYPAQLVPVSAPEGQRRYGPLCERLAARGYQEVVTYSFVEPALQAQLLPGEQPIALDNPIADTLSVMRTTLWSGLLPAWQFNQQRQQRRVRLFESGACFREQGGKVIEEIRLGGLVAGPAAPEQWGLPERPVDFHDVKADLESLMGADRDEFRFEAAEHPALHPGQSARILRGDREAGWLGVLHPRLVQALDLPEAPVLFDLRQAVLAEAGLPRPGPAPEFPSSRRDLAVVVPEITTADRLLAEVRAAGGPALAEVRVFDVYRGAGLPNGCKSIALGLIFQDNSSTLTDQQVDSWMQAVVDRLDGALGASIRG
jgi:phenylalanyl-tRNA synthetase beta chain